MVHHSVAVGYEGKSDSGLCEGRMGFEGGKGAN